ncbi:MAG: late competence development ComFB family protein [Peptococcaceae bacterium]|nr:late competence development ComFB family protein [Peptococcaceae bacterium]
MVKNYVEVAVEQLFDELLKNYTGKNPGTCTCEKCRDDMMALALNRIPPHYVATDKGSIITQVGFDLIGGKAQIASAILTAIKTVGANPRH